MSATVEPNDDTRIKINPARTTTYREGTPDEWSIDHSENVQVTIGQVTLFFDSPGAFNAWLATFVGRAIEHGFTGASGHVST